MRLHSTSRWILTALAVWTTLRVVCAEREFLNVSFDISREFYKAYNPAFSAYWKAQTGETLKIQQSHAGSSKQARAVLDGLEADVVTLNQVTDLDPLVAKGLVSADWKREFPNGGSPFYSTIVFLVRRGNPKHIRDWVDLLQPGLSVLIPNPKTSGNGRYGYLAAYASALKRAGGDSKKSLAFVRQLFAQVPILDIGGRAASTSFVQRGVGDVLITFEAEANLTLEEVGRDRLEMVVPGESIEADLPIAVVLPVVKRRGTEALARAYLGHLYSDEGQRLGVQHYFRPRSEVVAKQSSGRFASLKLFRVEDVLGSWQEVQATHFAEGGVFDQIYQKSR